ncbi:MAG: DUF3127 domain-containing protein [Hyphomicrobiales bacterium]
MSLEITGRIFQKLDEVSGEGRNGTWKKQEFILETEDQYPKKVCIGTWGDKVDIVKSLSLGEKVTASINVESREYNGRWYTDVRAWRIEKVAEQATAENAPTPNEGDFNTSPASATSEEDDLPF